MENPHLVSGQGRKRKRAGGEHASANRLSADAVKTREMQQSGFAQRLIPSNHGSLPLSPSGDRHAPPADRDQKTKTSSNHSKKQNGIHAAQQRFASLAEKRKELLGVRQKLPIWPHADKIRQALRGDNSVMLLVGETGSGKSTQVPQFLLTEKWCKGCIAVTQPDRKSVV